MSGLAPRTLQLLARNNMSAVVKRDLHVKMEGMDTPQYRQYSEIWQIVFNNIICLFEQQSSYTISIVSTTSLQHFLTLVFHYLFRCSGRYPSIQHQHLQMDPDA